MNINENDMFFNVMCFGASGDGLQKDTRHIQSAIDACAESGGGLVFFPKGNYITGTLIIKSNVTLYLVPEASLLGSQSLEDYDVEIQGCIESPNFNKCMIYAENQRNIAICGSGTIDGRGDISSSLSPGKTVCHLKDQCLCVLSAVRRYRFMMWHSAIQPHGAAIL